MLEILILAQICKRYWLLFCLLIFLSVKNLVLLFPWPNYPCRLSHTRITSNKMLNNANTNNFIQIAKINKPAGNFEYPNYEVNRQSHIVCTGSADENYNVQI